MEEEPYAFIQRTVSEWCELHPEGSVRDLLDALTDVRDEYVVRLHSVTAQNG